MSVKKKNDADPGASIKVAPINSNDPLLIYIDDPHFSGLNPERRKVPAEYLDILLSTNKIKIVNPVEDK